MGEACNSVCARNGNQTCNANVQSEVINEERFGIALSQAGHPMCKRVIKRRYFWGPFVADNGNTCVFLTPGFKSQCTQPKEPTHRPLCYCEDPCVGFQCGDNAVCDSLGGTPECVCPPGLIGDPDVICDKDDCKDVTCKNGGTCVDAIGSYSCLCPYGYVGNDCEMNEDVCKNTDFRAKSNDPGSKEIALKDKEGNGCSWYEEKPKSCGSHDTKEFQANTMCCVCKSGARDCSENLTWETKKEVNWKRGWKCNDYISNQWCENGGIGSAWNSDWSWMQDADGLDARDVCCACGGKGLDTKQDEEQKTGGGD